MKILMIVFNLTGKGTYWRAYNFGIELVKRGHKVTLITTSPKSRWGQEQYDQLSLKIIEMPDLLPGPLRSGWDFWNTLNRVYWLKDKQFDIVHAFECRPVVIFPALLAKKKGAKLIIDWADWFGRGGSVEARPNPLVRTIVRPLDTFFEEYYRHYADGHTVINQYLYERATVITPNRPITLIRNGAPSSVPLIPISKARSQLGIPMNNEIIGYVGGIYTEDAHLMAKAFNIINQQKPNVRLLLIGYFNRPIEKWIKTTQNVIRTGLISNKNDLYKYIAACDICWLPMKNSGANIGRWPYKLTDYMAVGRPTISTNIGDMVKFFTQYQIGITTNENPKALAQATIELFSDENKRKYYGQNAHFIAMNELSWKNLTLMMEEFYNHLLTN
ncbi:MAG TPA: glycosyltransferase family 4 protein [Anaerolineae bacterium]|nr:glycosyltransferase family 4 protein [Anaerolineae bacterium]